MKPSPVETKQAREAALEKKLQDLRIQEQAKIDDAFRKEVIAWIKRDPSDEAHLWRMILQDCSATLFEEVGDHLLVPFEMAEDPIFKALCRRFPAKSKYDFEYSCLWDGQELRFQLTNFYRSTFSFRDALEQSIVEWEKTGGFRRPLFKKI